MQGRESSPDSPEFVVIGQIVGPHGVKGGMRVKILTSFPERFEKGRVLYIKGERHKIERAGFHKEQVRIMTDKVTSCEAAEALKWENVSIPAGDDPVLEADEFKTSDLIGLMAVGTGGEKYGVVKDVLPNPAHDIFVLERGLVPVVKQFVKNIDLKSGTVTLELIPGMLEDA